MDEKNNGVGIYHDLGPAVDVEVSSMAYLVSVIFANRFFDQLRPNSCLGYVVLMNVKIFDNARLMSYIVQGEKSPEEIQECIENFITESCEVLQKMPEEEYMGYVCRAADAMKVMPKGLNAYFFEVVAQWAQMKFDLRRREDVSSAIRRIKKEEVAEFLKRKHKRIVSHATRSGGKE